MNAKLLLYLLAIVQLPFFMCAMEKPEPEIKHISVSDLNGTERESVQTYKTQKPMTIQQRAEEARCMRHIAAAGIRRFTLVHIEEEEEKICKQLQWLGVKDPDDPMTFFSSSELAYLLRNDFQITGIKDPKNLDNVDIDSMLSRTANEQESMLQITQNKRWSKLHQKLVLTDQLNKCVLAQKNTIKEFKIADAISAKTNGNFIMKYPGASALLSEYSLSALLIYKMMPQRTETDETHKFNAYLGIDRDIIHKYRKQIISDNSSDTLQYFKNLLGDEEGKTVNEALNTFFAQEKLYEEEQLRAKEESFQEDLPIIKKEEKNNKKKPVRKKKRRNRGQFLPDKKQEEAYEQETGKTAEQKAIDTNRYARIKAFVKAFGEEMVALDEENYMTVKYGPGIVCTILNGTGQKLDVEKKRSHVIYHQRVSGMRDSKKASSISKRRGITSQADFARDRIEHYPLESLDLVKPWGIHTTIDRGGEKVTVMRYHAILNGKYGIITTAQGEDGVLFHECFKQMNNINDFLERDSALSQETKDNILNLCKQK